MSNNGLIEYKENFITKIKNFLKDYLEEKMNNIVIYKKFLAIVLINLLITKRKINL